MSDVYTNPPQSRNEAIINSIIEKIEYTDPPQSRIEDLLLQLKTLIGGMESSLAPSYDKDESYSKGDLVIYENKLYECLSTTTGEWDSTKWNEVTIADIIAYLESEITDAEDVSFYDMVSDFPITGDETKLYVDKAWNAIYRWTGTKYEMVSEKNPIIYGYHVDGNESVPSSKITYLEDAVGMTPVHMDYTNDVFDYGSWRDTWIVKDCKPCILGQDGIVKKYLDKNDYTKDVDGNTVAIDSTLTDANVMIEFPKIYMKVVPDENDVYSGSVYFSNVRIDNDFHDFPYIDHTGAHKEHFYMAAFNGSTISNVIRSIKGETSNKTQNLEGTTEISYAEANGTGWSTEHAGQIQLINNLLILLGKSTNTQAVFGNGIQDGSQTAFNNYSTGSLYNKGMFYGANTGSTAVKVFGIENWWALQWRRYRGDILSSGNLLVKLCYGTEDGSTTHNFNTDGTGYRQITNGSPSGTNGHYIDKMLFDGLGMYVKDANNSNAGTDKGYCDGYWFNGSGVRFAFRGGASDFGALCGAFCVARNGDVSSRAWGIGAALSYI